MTSNKNSVRSGSVVMEMATCVCVTQLYLMSTYGQVSNYCSYGLLLPRLSVAFEQFRIT